jgi:hypothetical protein
MTATTSDIHSIRRANLLLLIRDYTGKQMAAGVDPTGIGKDFAEVLQISRSRLSQLKSARNFTDKLARQFEQLQDRPTGWMDQPHEAGVVSPGEEAFIALCRKAWTRQNAKGKRELRLLVEKAAGTGSPSKA